MEEKHNYRPGHGDWRPAQEAAPSVMLKDQPTVARFFGTFGVMLVAVGALALAFYAGGSRGWIGPGKAGFFVVTGLTCMLFHAVWDKDQFMRRIYGAFGALWIPVGALICFLPTRSGGVGSLALYGFICFGLGLLFLLAFLRNEDDNALRRPAIRGIGGFGALLAFTAFIGSNLPSGPSFILPHGLILALLGFGYLWAFVSSVTTNTEIGFKAGLGIGLLGATVFLIALLRTVMPPLFYSWGWTDTPSASYFVPTGMLLMALGLFYAGLSAGLCLDYPLVVMTRRELGAFFHSPIAYLVLFGFTFIAWIQFAFVFVPILEQVPLPQPIVVNYIIGLLPVLAICFIVPALTMRLLSEEKRSGTLEVLLTGPVNEAPIVVSKFLATFIFFMLVWIPWILPLVVLQIESGQTIDYRPLLSFAMALMCTGAGALGAGLFFSSLTRNQIISAILTTAFMLSSIGLYLVNRMLSRGGTSPWRPVVNHVSFLDLWISSLEGKLVPTYLLAHLSVAVLCLFLTIKVLEARKWT